MLYVATNLSRVERPDDGLLTVWLSDAVSEPDAIPLRGLALASGCGKEAGQRAKLHPAPLKNWRLYYKFTPRVCAWILREADQLERQMLDSDEWTRDALIRRCEITATRLQPLHKFASERFSPGKLEAALQSRSGIVLPRPEFAKEEVELEIYEDMPIL